MFQLQRKQVTVSSGRITGKACPELYGIVSKQPTLDTGEQWCCSRSRHQDTGIWHGGKKINEITAQVGSSFCWAAGWAPEENMKHKFCWVPAEMGYVEINASNKTNSWFKNGGREDFKMFIAYLCHSEWVTPPAFALASHIAHSSPCPLPFPTINNPAF